MTTLGQTDSVQEGPVQKDAVHGQSRWQPVCPVVRVPLDRGVAVLLGDNPVALFRLSPVGDQKVEILAVGHLDPVTGSPVIARGLVGSSGLPPLCIPTVASPLLKQRYNLRTGVCLDDSRLRLPTYAVRIVEGTIELAAAG